MTRAVRDFQRIAVPADLRFQGRSLTLAHYRGRPVWIAREIGRVLGYGNDGRRLLTSMRQRWADELFEGQDFLVLTGDELAGFRQVVTDSVTTPEAPSLKSAPSLTLLFETGLHLICLKSRKPLGRVLRRWLASEALPWLYRGGAHRLPAPSPPPPLFAGESALASYGDPASGPMVHQRWKHAHAADLMTRLQSLNTLSPSEESALLRGLLRDLVRFEALPWLPSLATEHSTEQRVELLSDGTRRLAHLRGLRDPSAFFADNSVQPPFSGPRTPDRPLDRG
jgi:prophage antirepressor-like protein